MTNDLPQAPANPSFPSSAGEGRQKGRQAEQLRGPLVCVEDALVGIQSNNAFDHAAEDGAQLLAILF